MSFHKMFAAKRPVALRLIANDEWLPDSVKAFATAAINGVDDADDGTIFRVELSGHIAAKGMHPVSNAILKVEPLYLAGAD